jgi:serine/threonine protein kinase
VSPTAQNATVIGTPAYMAPETARSGVADARSDIYSVGIIFYEMLTGTIPFDGESAVQIMVKQVSEVVDPPSHRNPRVEITPEAERVIMKALEKNPHRRYQTMEELNAELHRCYGQVRFRRPVMPSGHANFEALRKPIALTPDKMKRKTGSDIPVPGQLRRPTPANPPVVGERATAQSSEPVRLTRRKSGRHETLPLGTLPPPDDDES